MRRRQKQTAQQVILYGHEEQMVIWTGKSMLFLSILRNLKFVMKAIVAIFIVMPASAAVKVTVSYDVISVEVLPIPSTHRTHFTKSYTLYKNKDVVFSQDQHSSRNQLGDDGEAIDRVEGETYRWSYKITNGAFMTESRYPGFIAKQTIFTNGKDSCTFSRKYTKTQKHKYFEELRSTNRDHMFISDKHIENSTCVIEEVAD